ncbi:MAG TPA: hypothetical protein VHU82_02170 [Vicinamibacterales bacterium]|jgi:hypothetical protein|nr:hypothetical protein [Vicinamibacterales bacterium]
MRPGNALHRMIRLTCSTEHVERVLGPALADLQYEWATSKNRWELLWGYLAVWRSWGACLLDEATSPESRSFGATVLGRFALTVAGLAAIEFVLMHSSFALRRQLLLLNLPLPTVLGRVVAAAMYDTATLRYGVPIAIGPALFYATRRTGRVAPAVYVPLLIFAIFGTVTTSGWIAPALVRREATRQHERFVAWAAHAPSSSVQGWYVPPLEFSSFQPAKSWPELLHSAAEPPRHEFPLMPQYVAPGEQIRPAADRREVVERILLVVVAVSAAMAGATLGRLTSNDSKQAAL